MSDPRLKQLEADLLALKTRRKFHALSYYQPYPKQLALHNLKTRERMLRAGNQLGKTYCAAAETAMHLTGQYPDWWKGIRYEKPPLTWCAGEDSAKVRDRMQSLLYGPAGLESELGTGFVPKDCILDRSLSRGVTDAYDTVMVKHVNGTSVQRFKSYEQGRKKFASDPVDFLWLDEEPEFDIYSECLTRTTSTEGNILITFTPLLGRTPLLTRFMDIPSPDRAEVVMTIYEVGWSEEKIRKELEKYPEWERDARAMGVPMMGEGRVFPYADDLITEDPIIEVPKHWTKLWGIDFGTGGNSHPFAAVLQLWDRDTDTLHVHRAFKTPEQLVAQHCAMMQQIAGAVPVAWPHDGNQKERGAADETMTTAKLYKKGGLRMLPEHATFEDGGISTEAGITEMSERMLAGKYKVSRALMQGDWGSEFRNYHRKDGKLVKLNDDLMSASRIALMAKRKGDTVPVGPGLFRGFNNFGPRMASGIDFDLFG